MPPIAFRPARSGDAEAIAALHADSWRRHYRGTYADAFLDGDVLADRLAVWRERLRRPDPGSCARRGEADNRTGLDLGLQRRQQRSLRPPGDGGGRPPGVRPPYVGGTTDV